MKHYENPIALPLKLFVSTQLWPTKSIVAIFVSLTRGETSGHPMSPNPKTPVGSLSCQIRLLLTTKAVPEKK